ncbi:phage late control D family protein [Haliangium sp.]|uniref:phage late control D family protein n=1 Tax=Haliangium sp. TaxID=2663208 RepID=UPI003D0FF320
MSAGLSERQTALHADYYAPRFEVRVAGAKLAPIQDVLSCKVVMDVNNLTSFDLSVNNWDEEAFDFKYVDLDTFSVGQRVSIDMGYADRLEPMMTGFITAMTPRFPESGPPSMSVSGQDDMILLKGRKPGAGDKKQWTKVYDWEIAQEIARRNQLDAEVTKEGPQHEVVVQKDQDDATFLMERAKRIDFDCFIRTDLDSKKAKLHFIAPKDKRDGRPLKVYVFTWGKNLINFNPRLSIANQVSKVTVRGWDPKKKEVVTATADASKLPAGGQGSGSSGPDIVARALGSKQEATVDVPVTSQAEADELAKSLLTERAYQFITGTGRCIGLPDLRAGDVVELRKLGTRFSGDYYVTKVEHSISSSGYFTQFDVRRTHDGGSKG